MDLYQWVHYVSFNSTYISIRSWIKLIHVKMNRQFIDTFTKQSSTFTFLTMDSVRTIVRFVFLLCKNNFNICNMQIYFKEVREIPFALIKMMFLRQEQSRQMIFDAIVCLLSVWELSTY